MYTAVIPAKVLENVNYLYKHLFDSPVEHPTNIPKINPIGNEITELKDISAMLGVDEDIASVYVLQDPTANVELKEQAREVLTPGIFVASEDAFLPVVHKAHEIIHNPAFVEEKRVRMVRTVAGVRRFKQKAGSIIVDDGEPPLDALVALPNDVPGYEKIGSKGGGVFYVGKNGSKWVVRDPLTGDVINKSGTQEEALRWLNKNVGGSATQKQPDGSTSNSNATTADRVLGRTANSTTRRVDEIEAARDKNLTLAQAAEINKLSSEELDLYRRLRERGIDYDTAIIIARALKPRRTRRKS